MTAEPYDKNERKDYFGFGAHEIFGRIVTIEYDPNRNLVILLILYLV